MPLEVDTAPILYTLVIILAVALAVMITSIVLVLRWNKKTEDTLYQMRSELGAFTTQLESLRAIQQDYSVIHRQPYAALSADLLKKDDAIFEEAFKFEQDYDRLNNLHNYLPENRVTAIFLAVPDAYRNQRLAGDLWMARERIQGMIAEAQALARAMESVPVETAGQARQAGEGIKELETLMAGLHEAGLHGKLVDEVDDALLRLQQGVARIPPSFTAAETPDLEAGDPRETASHVYEILNDIQPVVGEWLPRVQAWDQQYKRAVEAYDTLRKTAANFRTVLDTPPAALIVDGFRSELEKVRATAKALNKRLSEPVVEDLRALERETSQAERVVQDGAVRYDKSVQQVTQLDRALLELETEDKTAAASLAEVETLQVYPLAWDVSRPSLAEMEAKIQGLGARDKRRTPEQVSEALAAAQDLLARQKTFAAQIAETRGWHTELLALLASGDIREGEGFLQEAGVLAREVAGYDPANWNKQDDAPNLGRDVGALTDLHRQLVAAEQPAQVKESSLAKRLEATRTLAELHPRTRARLERISARLDEIQKAEKDAVDELVKASATLDSLGVLARDNPYLLEIAGAEIERLRVETEKLQDELSIPAQGAVDRKVSRANALLDGMARSTNTWLDKLAANLQIHTQKIADTLAALDQAASLDDREVGDARGLLSRLGVAPMNRKTGLSYLEAAAELKRWNNDWQSCAAASTALQALAGPVLDAANDADQASKAARAALLGAGKLASGRRDWPPTRQSLVDEVKAFQVLEARLEGLHARRISSGGLVRELGQLYHELDLLEDKVSKAARQADEEQRAAGERERQIEGLQQRWQAQATRYAGQAAVADGVKDLLSQADSRVAYLKGQYKRGSLEYEQVLDGLQELADGLMNARFTTEDGQSVSLSQG